MLQTIEAEISVDGTVTLFEPVKLNRPTKALVTILENGNGETLKGNVGKVLKFLKENRLPEESRLSVQEIDEQIREARDSWD